MSTHDPENNLSAKQGKLRNQDLLPDLAYIVGALCTWYDMNLYKLIGWMNFLALLSLFHASNIYNSSKHFGIHWFFIAGSSFIYMELVGTIL